MAGDIKVGDVVQLKSGRPDMTVSEVGMNNAVMKGWCVWFEGSDNKKGVFPITSLRLVK
jgi:uncharacterized protein YodC (DUF2158 family)